MAADLFFLFSSGVAKKYVGANLGPTHRRARTRSERRHDAAPMLRPVGPVVAGQTGDETNERHPERTRRGRRTQSCSRVGRLPRTPSIDVEMKEEQQMIDEKKLGQKKSKKIKVFVFNLLDNLNRP